MLLSLSVVVSASLLVKVTLEPSLVMPANSSAVPSETS